MSEEHGHFEQGRWVEDSEPAADAPAIEERIQEPPARSRRRSMMSSGSAITSSGHRKAGSISSGKRGRPVPISRVRSTMLRNRPGGL
ncbi:hypothetical protein [Methanoculleus bourgensis]|uniref:hypothetical protein n=1 Tax=Methanoculleus bourgensis TaxID=83986 RepID=UPI001EE18FB2|nr:hypothetical protein [Methanoculleus bourgensis]